MKKYNVSIIVPVYNTEDYLDDCIKSIINQSYGFDNIELVLVNDGSKDRSLEICNKYKEKYSNIKVITKENSGVSDTRNLGFKESTGKYIMFLDADDLINKDSIKYLSKFLDENKNVLFVISRVRMFEKTNKWHYMDYRFKDDNKFINMDKDITYCQYHSTGILIRRKAIEDIKFDKSIKYAEDMKYISEVLFKNKVWGKEKRSILYYRKRFAETSAVQKQVNDPDFYSKTMESSFRFIYDKALETYKCFPKYFQYYILNSLVERFDIEYNNVLNEKDFKKYISTFEFFIKNIDDDIILMQKRTGFNIKYYLLKLKHGDKYKINVDYEDSNIIFNGEKFKFKASEFIKILKLDFKNNKFRFYISKNDYLFKDRINVYVDNNVVKTTKVKDTKDFEVQKYRDISFNVFYENSIEYFDVDIDKIKNISFRIDGKKVNYALSKSFGTYSFRKRYLMIHKKLLFFGKYDITKKRSITFIKNYMYNLLYLIKYNDYYDVFVKNGKVHKKMRKLY